MLKVHVGDQVKNSDRALSWEHSSSRFISDSRMSECISVVSVVILIPHVVDLEMALEPLFHGKICDQQTCVGHYSVVRELGDVQIVQVSNVSDELVVHFIYALAFEPFPDWVGQARTVVLHVHVAHGI